MLSPAVHHAAPGICSSGRSEPSAHRGAHPRCCTWRNFACPGGQSNSPARDFIASLLRMTPPPEPEPTAAQNPGRAVRRLSAEEGHAMAEQIRTKRVSQRPPANPPLDIPEAFSTPEPVRTGSDRLRRPPPLQRNAAINKRAKPAGQRCRADELACKPDSVPHRLRGAAATIHLGTPSPGTSSGLPADSGEQPSNTCATAP